MIFCRLLAVVGRCSEGSDGKGVLGVELPHYSRKILVHAFITGCEDAKFGELLGVREREESLCSECRFDDDVSKGGRGVRVYFKICTMGKMCLEFGEVVVAES